MWWRHQASADRLTIVLRLQTIDHLFTSPDLTPFDPEFAASSFGPGIDYVVREMQRVPGKRHTELTVLLPEDQIEGVRDLETRTMAAIRRYATAWIASASQTHAVERRQARAVSVSAVLFFAVATLLSANYAHDGSLVGIEGPLLEVVLDGLSVGAWVALWWPFDLLFQEWEHRLEERTYRALPEITLHILPDHGLPIVD